MHEILPPSRGKSPPLGEERLKGYLLAIAAVATATVLRLGSGPLLADRTRYLPFLVAVVLPAWYGGLGPGLLALAGSVAVITYSTPPPWDSPPYVLLADSLALGLFVATGVAIALLSEAQLKSRRRVAMAVADLTTKQGELEAEIGLRRETEGVLKRREDDLRRQAADLAAAQRATAESLAILDTFIRHAPVGMAVYDEELRFLRVNAAMAEINAVPLEDHIGRTVGEVLGPIASHAVPMMRRVLETGEPIIHRVVGGRNGDANGRTWRVSYYPVRVNDGRTLGLGSIVEDISDQLAARRELEESEARFRSLAEAVPQIVWVTRPDGFHTYFNERWFQYTGMTPEESIGWGWSVPLHPDDRERSEQSWREATESGEPYEIEYRFRGADGEYRWFLGRAMPQRDARSAIVRWFGTCTDIDDSKRAVDELRRSEERFRALSEHLPQIVWTATPWGHVEYYNQSWYDYTGLELGRTGDEDWKAMLHPDDREASATAWQESLRRCDRHEIELRLKGHDGSYRWHLVMGAPLRDAEGTVIQWIGTITDIDDRKRAAEILEKEVRERTAELERSNQELEQFAYVASHDLQEPLRKIQAFGDRLNTRAREGLGEQGREYLDRILNSAGRMRTLIDDLLSFSRVTTKAQPFEAVPLDRIAREVLSDLEERIRQSGGRVEVGPLPVVEADPIQMRQLIQNLVGNALKFHKPGEPPIVRVDVRDVPKSDRPEGAADRPYCALVVADNGIGFEEIYSERIFQVFQRLHGRMEYDGTGVGLAICRKIAERHGGSIRAEGVPGQGATFTVHLPQWTPPIGNDEAD